jgi:predicted transposase YbfD/YdcC
MDATAAAGFLHFFRDLPDPRRGCNAIHKLHDIVVIAVLAVICGADGWAQVELFGRSKAKWLGTFLDLPDGIPSHDTFGRVFARLDPDAFERCFVAWMSALVDVSGGRLIAIDGKAIRRSFARAWDKSGMAHLVSAFVRGNQMVFGQLAVDGKSNEITAIPRLLALLDLKGAVVTIDAMGCQRAVAAAVVAGGGDYVLALKDNHPTLRRKALALMTEAALDHAKGGDATAGGADGSLRRGVTDRVVEAGHGRVEARRVLVTDDLTGLGKAAAGWAGLGSVVMVESERQNLGDTGDTAGRVTTERRLYLSSIRSLDAGRMADLVRGHWSVENKLHWQLDVSFDEDQRRIRTGHGAENYSRLCRIALNLLKRDTTVKAGIKSKRLTAGWDHDYLLRLISG